MEYFESFGVGKKWKFFESFETWQKNGNFLKVSKLGKKMEFFLKVSGLAKKWKFFESFGVGKKMNFLKIRGWQKNGNILKVSGLPKKWNFIFLKVSGNFQKKIPLFLQNISGLPKKMKFF